MSSHLLNKLIATINSFSTDFRKEPYSYLLESDIQSALFVKLRNEINQYTDVVGINEEKYHLNLIYTEHLDRFDICCLNPEKIKTITKYNVTQNKGHDDYIYQLPVLLAIELKYIWAHQRRSFETFTSDAEKIKKSQFNHKVDKWLSICFIQTENATEWQLKNSNKNYGIIEVKNITNLNSSYIISPNTTYEISKI